MWNAKDTIAQIATAPGNGVGVVRISGPAAHMVGRALAGVVPTPRVLQWAEAKDADGQTIDSGLYVEFVAPRSFTGEAVAEFQAHGSAVGLAQVLRRCVQLGARAAEAGEFSLRAFRNGKLDLAQVEAMAAAVAAESDAAFRLAQRQAQGELSQAVHAIRAPLLDAATALVAEVEFPDEDLASMDRERVTTRLHEASVAIRSLLGGFAAARRLSEGATVSLIGPPNAGKSSVLNALLGFERAIVSPVAGTTRDTVEASFVLDGVVCRLIDTAGLRDAANDIEAAGIARSESAAQHADIVLWLQSPDVDLLKSEWLPRDSRVIRVLNKSDLGDESPLLADWCGGQGQRISARTGAGLAELRVALRERLLPSAGGAPGLVSQERHARLLGEADEALQRAARALDAEMACELVLVDVNISIHRLGEVIGENVAEDVLAQIFKRFCIGK